MKILAKFRCNFSSSQTNQKKLKHFEFPEFQTLSADFLYWKKA